MPASENSLITVETYNLIRTTVANLLGPGSGNQGYGQQVTSVSKVAPQTVSQSDWDRLRFDLLNVRVHQTGAAFTATTNASNSSDQRKLTFLSSESAFLILGMAVFGTGSDHPIRSTKFITDIEISGSNRIITLNTATEFPVGSSTVINFGPSTVSDFNEGTLVGASSVNAYESLSNTSLNDRFLVANGQFVTDSAVSTSRTWSTQTTPQFWKDEISCEITITFNNFNEARYFFNSGGEIRITSSRTEGRSDPQNNSWSSLLAGAGQQSFGAQIPTTGFTPMNGQNFYRLTSSYQTYFSLDNSVPYADNTYQIEAKCNVDNNSSGTANVVYIKVRFIGGYIDPGSYPLDDPNTNDEIDGVFSVVVSEKRASGKMLPAGSFSIARPLYSISTLSGT